jgi:hypothetical protein
VALRKHHEGMTGASCGMAHLGSTVRPRPVASTAVGGGCSQLVTRFPRACSGAARSQAAIGYAHGSGGGKPNATLAGLTPKWPDAWSTSGPLPSDPLHAKVVTVIARSGGPASHRYRLPATDRHVPRFAASSGT